MPPLYHEAFHEIQNTIDYSFFQFPILLDM